MRAIDGLQRLTFKIGEEFLGFNEIELLRIGDHWCERHRHTMSWPRKRPEDTGFRRLTARETWYLEAAVEESDLLGWSRMYNTPALNGDMWSMKLTFVDGQTRLCVGASACPEGFTTLLRVLSALRRSDAAFMSSRDWSNREDAVGQHGRHAARDEDLPDGFVQACKLVHDRVAPVVSAREAAGCWFFRMAGERPATCMPAVRIKTGELLIMHDGRLFKRGVSSRKVMRSLRVKQKHLKALLNATHAGLPEYIAPVRFQM